MGSMDQASGRKRGGERKRTDYEPLPRALPSGRSPKHRPVVPWPPRIQRVRSLAFAVVVSGVFFAVLALANAVPSLALPALVDRSAQVDEPEAHDIGQTFSDVPSGHPYRDAIEDLAGGGVIEGYDDGRFGPDDLVLRQQFAKMIVGTLGLPCSEADVSPFSDVADGGPSTLYPDNYIAVCAANGITEGKTPSTYAPYDNITRAQVITMVVRAAQRFGVTLFQPNAAYPAWAFFFGFSDPDHGQNVQLAEYNRLLNGIQGRGDPLQWVYQPATRGEVAQILWNLSNAGVAG